MTSESVSPIASQTCSLWGTAKENELQKCKEDLLSTDEEKIFCASSRIAKVMAGLQTPGHAWRAGLSSAGCSFPLGVAASLASVKLVHLDGNVLQ